MYSRLSIKIIRQGAIEFMVKLAKMLKVAMRGHLQKSMNHGKIDQKLILNTLKLL